MSLKVKLISDKKISDEKAFSVLDTFEIREKLVAEVIRSEMLNLRSGNAHTKIRSEVRGGGRKPWKQKGTGRARHGSKRSPIWVGGGITFGPRNDRNWHRKINSSARLSALKSILKDKLSNDSVFQLAQLNASKTKDALTLADLVEKNKGLKNKDLLIIYTTDEKTDTKGFCNLENKMMNAKNLKLHQLLGAKAIVLTPSSREVLETRISK